MRTKPRLIHSVHHRNARGTSARSEPKATPARSGPRSARTDTHTHTRRKTPRLPHRATELRGGREIRTRSGRPRRRSGTDQRSGEPAARGGRIGAALTGRSVGGGGGGEDGSGVARARVASPLAVPLKISMRAWEGRGGRWWGEVAWVRTARLVSSSPFYRSFCFPPGVPPLLRSVAGERCLACRDAVVVVCFYLCGGGLPFLIAPGALRLRCSAGLGKRRVGGAEMHK